jgi:hypothetical protein
MEMKWAGHVARMIEKLNTYRILLGKPGGKSSLGRSRRRCVDNIKILERQNGVVWTGSIWLRIRDKWRALVNTVMNIREVLE